METFWKRDEEKCMTTDSDTYTFDELTDVLRERIRDADALNAGALHSFKELMSDLEGHIARQFYWEAFEELEAQGHLAHVSTKLMGGDACARLSADGRLYFRSN